MKPSDGVKRIDESIARARGAIDAASSMFQGTLPPPPWPSPELYKAIDDAKDVRERLDVFVRHGDPDFNAKTPQVARVVAEVERRISAVDEASKRLQERREIVSTQTPAGTLVKLKTLANDKKVFGLLALGYLLWKAEKPRRR